MKRSKLVFLIGGAIIGLGAFANQRALDSVPSPDPSRSDPYTNPARGLNSGTAVAARSVSDQQPADREKECDQSNCEATRAGGGGGGGGGGGYSGGTQSAANTHGGFGNTGAHFASGGA